MFTLILRLLQVDFSKVESHVGMEFCNISGPGEKKQSCQLVESSVYMLNCAHASTFSERGTRNGCISTCHYTNAELSKTQPTFQEEQSPAAKSIFNSKPLGKWSFHTV